MYQTTLAQIADWTGGAATADCEIRAVSTDSRAIPAGCLFVPLVGERFDAHDFIGQAVENGAAAVLSHRREETYPVPTVYVEDTAQALLDLAGGVRDEFSGPVAAVTGSVGKTTTKELVAAVLAQGFETLKTPANKNNTIGLPLTLLTLDEGTEAAVVELGMNHFGEIFRMAAAAKPDVAVITNIGTSHIGNLGSREGICRAKLEITEGLAERGGCAVLPADEPLLWERREEFDFRVLWYGIRNDEALLRAQNLRMCADGVDFDLCWQRAVYPMHLKLVGLHNVSNALAAAAVGFVVGLDAEQIAEGLASVSDTDTHARVYDAQGFHIYEDVYNASPDAMVAALGTFRALEGGRHLAVLGSMLELGDYADEGHRRAGRAAVESADALYLYGEHAQSMRAGALAGGMDEGSIHCFDDHAALAAALRAEAQPGDALLFKGSHGMHMERALALFLE